MLRTLCLVEAFRGLEGLDDLFIKVLYSQLFSAF